MPISQHADRFVVHPFEPGAEARARQSLAQMAADGCVHCVVCYRRVDRLDDAHFVKLARADEKPEYTMAIACCDLCLARAKREGVS